MALFDTLVGDIAGRFGLGASAGPLLREVLTLVTGSPGGIGGFLDKLRSAGLGSETASWLGRADAPALSGQQVDRALGSTVLGGIASRLGLTASAVSTAVGYILPRVIGALTPGGTVPTKLPAEVTSFLSSPAAPRATAVKEPVAPWQSGATHDKRRRSAWLLPLLGIAALAGLASVIFWPKTPAPVTQAPFTQAPAPPATVPVPALPPRLAINNDAGVIHYAGSVHDDATRASILDSLKAVFGADRIQGDIGIDANRAAAPWLANLRSALENFKVPGLRAVFDGNSINLGGVGDLDRGRILTALKSLFGGLSFGVLADKWADIATAANSKAVAGLTSLKTGFSANDLVGILNLSIINFPTDGADVPAAEAALLQAAATQIRKLPPGTVLEVAGYTDNTGDAAANAALSQRRADAIRSALIQAGVDPSMLVAKGYGSANPVGSNESDEGRLHNRRIEYHVIRS
jgi:outer membrane protein OmpA-like peptidoglycan-associated protein/uncharacterized protein YidB (DUF937 family)